MTHHKECLCRYTHGCNVLTDKCCDHIGTCKCLTCNAAHSLTILKETLGLLTLDRGMNELVEIETGGQEGGPTYLTRAQFESIRYIKDFHKFGRELLKFTDENAKHMKPSVSIWSWLCCCFNSSYSKVE